MTISPELIPLIAEVRQHYRELAHLSDEEVAQLVLDAINQQPNENMTAEQCGRYGEELWTKGQWEEAERFFLAALEKGEKESDLDSLMAAYGFLAHICRDRGNFYRAINYINTDWQ